MEFYQEVEEDDGQLAGPSDDQAYGDPEEVPGEDFAALEQALQPPPAAAAEAAPEGEQLEIHVDLQRQMELFLAQQGWQPPAAQGQIALPANQLGLAAALQPQPPPQLPAIPMVAVPVLPAAAAPLDPAQEAGAVFPGDQGAQAAQLLPVGEDYLAQHLRAYETEEELGDPLPDGEANFANRALRHVVQPETERTMMAAYKRPANMPGLILPRVNASIWRSIKRKTQGQDVLLQRAQGQMQKGMIPILRAMSALNIQRDFPNRDLILEGFQLMALGTHSLSTARRSIMATDLKPVYRPLCAPARPVTDCLFGDEAEVDRLSKDLREAEASRGNLGYGDQQPGQRGRGRGGRGAGTQRGRGGSQRRGAHPYGARGGRGGNPHFLGGRGAQNNRQGAPPAKKGGKVKDK